MSCTRCLPAEIQGIIARSSAPTFSIGWACPCARSCSKRARPDSDSAIHSSANEPSRMSLRIWRISAFTASLMIRGPRVTSPYSAVSLIE
jgi:hypothetical protein